MSSSSSRTWRILLRDKQDAFVERQCELPPAITSEASFRNSFEALCRSKLEHSYTRLLFKLKYEFIEDFASSVDAALDYISPNSLAALVSGGLFAVFQSACGAGIPLVQVVEMLGDLNSAVPELGMDIPRFPGEPTVQKPLQDIFRAYMDTLLSMVSCVQRSASNETGPIQEMRSYIDDTMKKFEVGRATFVRMLELAVRKPPREPSMSLSNFSESNLSMQKHHPYDTQAKFRVIESLGRGCFGMVDKVEEASSHQVYARKQISLPNSSRLESAAKEEEVRNEFMIMKKLKHHIHIATVLFWQKEYHLCNIFMEPAGDCDLRKFLHDCTDYKFPALKLQKMLPWFGCLLDALAYAHNKGIMHRDIKPSNIILKEDQVFLADFGLAKDFTLHDTSNVPSHQICGTPVYRAPEVTRETPRDYKADVFSLGCVFSEMLTVYGRKSLEAYQSWRQNSAHEPAVAFKANLPKVEEWLDQLKRDSPDRLQRFLVYQITTMLARHPKDRPSAQDGVKSFKADQQGVSLFCPDH